MEFHSSLDPSASDEELSRRALRWADGEAWLSEGDGPVRAFTEHGVHVREAEEGAYLTVRGAVGDLEALDASLARAIEARGMRVVRRWQRLPRGVVRVSDALCSTEGVDGDEAELSVLATRADVQTLTHKNLAPSTAVRGAVWTFRGQRLLLAAGAVSQRGDVRMHPGALARQLRQAIENLRVLVSQFNLKPQGIDYGFGLEDLVLLRVCCEKNEDIEVVASLVQRYLDPDCHLSVVCAGLEHPDDLVSLDAVFLKKGEYLRPSRKKYPLVGGLIRVESLELHVAEHCNLRCRGCDAMSPLNDARFLSLDEARSVLARMAAVVRADIFKLMGGEPLLHPQLVEMIALVRASGITRVIRLTTNGLLLHTMPDAFWQGLDRLTVSNYASAPIPAARVAMIEEKSERFGVVLNLKRIDHFNDIERIEPIEDRARVQALYDDCWIRHRSLIVRDGVFFKCTRAAYLDDFREKLRLPLRPGDAVRYRDADGIPLDAPDFLVRAQTYLNDASPLGSCRYCLGASGGLVPHTQLTRREIRAMRGQG